MVYRHFMRQLMFNLICLSIILGCTGTVPVPSKDFKKSDFINRGSVSVFRSAYGLIAYPTVSPNGELVASASTSGDLYIASLDGSNESMIYNKETDKNLKAVYIKEKVDISENPYARNVAPLLALSDFIQKWAEGVREITDISLHSPSMLIPPSCALWFHHGLQ